MVQAWIREVPIGEIGDDSNYFLARKRATYSDVSYLFYGSDIKHKPIMTEKPGIADHIIGNQKLRDILLNHPDHVAIAIPDDHATRWKRRKKR